MGKKFKQLTNEDLWVANKHMKRWPTLLVFREMQLNHNEMPLYTHWNG